MVPGIPTTDRIVGQTVCTLGFARAVFDKEALGLNPGQFAERGIGWDVGKTVVEHGMGAYDARPDARFGVGPVPDPHTGLPVLGHPRALLALPPAASSVQPYG